MVRIQTYVSGSEAEMARLQTPTGDGEEGKVRIQEWMVGYIHTLEE